MDVYNFFNRNTTGFLTNFLSEVLGGPVKFVEYEEVTRNFKKDENPEITLKIFKFGLNGKVFEFLIIPDNEIRFYFHNTNLGITPKISHQVESVKLSLLQKIRDYKINQII